MAKTPKTLRQQSAELSLRLEAFSAEVLDALRPALIKGAEETASAMRALVPVDDGDLRDSITVTPPGGMTPAYAEGGGKRAAGPNQALVTAGSPKVRHGHLQEFGTVAHEAQPFMRPGARLARPKALRRIKRAITKAIRKAAEGKT